MVIPDVNKITAEESEFEKRLSTAILQVFSDVIQDQEFVQPENKDMVQFVTQLICGVYSCFVVAYKYTPHIVDLPTAIGSFKAGIDAFLAGEIDKQNSATMENLEDPELNMPR